MSLFDGPFQLWATNGIAAAYKLIIQHITTSSSLLSELLLLIHQKPIFKPNNLETTEPLKGVRTIAVLWLFPTISLFNSAL